MKKIGIIFAMKEELDETMKLFDNSIVHSIYDLKIYECRNNNAICFLVESGIGKVNAARSTQILIDKMEVDYVLNVGVAGAVSNQLHRFDIVIGDKLVQHDFDLTLFDHEKGFIPGATKFFECDANLVKIAESIKVDKNIVTGVIASGDIFISDEKMGEKINKKFNALCVEMEGAAIAQVCYLCKVPFLVVRAISDSPYEEDNHIAFDEFLNISSDTAAKFIYEFLTKV